MKYNGQSLEFINRYYFKIKGKGSDNYETIVSIMRVTVVFPLTLLIVFTHLVTIYIYPKLNILIKKHLEDKNVNENDVEDSKHLGLKIASIRALALTCFLLNLAFVVFHIISVTEYIQYGNEVLFNHNSVTASNDHQAIPMYHAVLSLIPIAIALLYATFAFLLKNRHNQNADINSIHSINGIGDIAGRCIENPMPAAELLAANIIYIGSYFMPYMLLAFIHDPLQTSFIYLVVTAFIVCGYLTGLTLCGFASDKIKLLYLALSLATAASVVYFLVIIIYILTLGNFHDFEAIQNLLLPLVIGFLSLFIFKPVYKQLKARAQHTKDSNNNEEDANIIINLTSQNNEESHNASVDQNICENTHSNENDIDGNDHCSEND